jgi:malate dehydrogenase (oxaloacetate-decarboxylating)
MAGRKSKFSHLPLSTTGPIECALEGTALLETPAFNKGAEFPLEEREAFGLTGLVTARVGTLEDQVERAYGQYQERNTPLGKNT